MCKNSDTVQNIVHHIFIAITQVMPSCLVGK